MKVMTPFNYDREIFRDYDKDMGVSETLPDQTMSMRTIMHRFVNNMPIDLPHREVIWDEEAEGISPQLLDYAEREQILNEAEDLQQRLDNQVSADRQESPLGDKNAVVDLQQQKTESPDSEDVTESTSEH